MLWAWQCHCGDLRLTAILFPTWLRSQEQACRHERTKNPPILSSTLDSPAAPELHVVE